LVFVFVSAQLQGFSNLLLPPKPRQKPKILAAHRYIISVNALNNIRVLAEQVLGAPSGNGPFSPSLFSSSILWLIS